MEINLSGGSKVTSSTENREVVIETVGIVPQELTIFLPLIDEDCALAIDTLVAQLQRVRDSLPQSVR